MINPTSIMCHSPRNDEVKNENENSNFVVYHSTLSQDNELKGTGENCS